MFCSGCGYPLVRIAGADSPSEPPEVHSDPAAAVSSTPESIITLTDPAELERTPRAHESEWEETEPAATADEAVAEERTSTRAEPRGGAREGRPLNLALIARRCPECGRGFDPSDPRSFLAARLNARGLALKAWLALALMITAFMLGTFLAGALEQSSPSAARALDTTGFMAAQAAGWWLFFISKRAKAGLRGPPDDGPWCWFALTPAILLILLLVSGFALVMTV